MITLRNPRYPELEPVEVEALADTGAVHTVIPERIALQLRLEKYDEYAFNKRYDRVFCGLCFSIRRFCSEKDKHLGAG